MVVTISNRGRQGEQKPTIMRISMMSTLKRVLQNYQSRHFERVFSMMNTMTMMKAKTTMKTVTVAHHG